MPPKTTFPPRSRTARPTSYPRSAFPVWMPIPTTSPGCTCCASNTSSVSSQMIGLPKRAGVAAASTYSHRGVITAVPNETWLGFTRNTRIPGSPV